MSYDYGTTPISPLDAPMEEPPQKKPTMLIIIIVILVVLCCCCLFALGAGSWLWNNGDELFNITQRLTQLIA